MARLHREIVATLLERIVGGTYAPGTALPKEEALVAEFKVARGTAREALRALEERRVVRVKHGRGATVLDPDDWNVLDPEVAQALLRGRGRRRMVDELAELLAMLEPEAAALAAERASDAELERLGEAGPDFTAALASAAHNRPLAATLRALHDLLQSAPAAPGDPATASLASALATRDREAARSAARERLTGSG
jgi:DNA-binding FadR family transcriptional regulator